MTDLDLFIREIPRIDPDANVIEFEGRWGSWGQLTARIDEIASLVATLTKGAPTRVGAMLRNRPPHLSALYALIAHRHCLVTLNPLYPDAAIAADIVSLRLPIVIGTRADLGRPGVFEAARANGTALVALPDGDEPPTLLVPAAEGATIIADAPGVMIEMLTSGTTGTPKRVPLMRAAFEASFHALLRADGVLDAPPTLRPGVLIFTSPLTHIGGIWTAMNGLCGGRRMALIEKFSVERWVDAVVRHRPRAIGVTAATLRMVLDAGVPAADLSSLKLVTSGAAATDPAIVDEFMEHYGIPVLTNYGATEFAGPVARWSLSEFLANWREKRGSVGRLNVNIDGRVVDPDTGQVLAPGEEGVLELRGEQLVNPRGWLRTTDRARIDADGFLWVIGRVDGVINRGGFKVSPEAVVAALERHPAVREAAVVGIADARLGQVPVAAIVLRRGATDPGKAALDAHLRQLLAPSQLPVRYRVLDDLPRTASMKPVLPAIAALFAN